MKKIIIQLLITVIMFLSLSINSYAEESLQLYAASNEQNIIQSNMYDDTPSYMSFFGTENVIFDFERMLPVYYINDYNRQGTSEFLTDIMFFSERYKVPVYDSNNTFLGFAEFGEIQPINALSAELQNDPSYIEKCIHHIGEWEIKSFSEGNFENILNNKLTETEKASFEGAIAYSEVFYVEIYPLQKRGLLYVTNGDTVSEQFCEIYNYDSSVHAESEAYVSGTDILNEIISAIDHAEEVGGIWDDSGFPYNEKYDENGEIVYEEYIPAEELASDDILEEVSDNDDIQKQAENISQTKPTETEGNLFDGSSENPKTGNAGISTVIAFIGISGLCILCLNKKTE